jgi:hypothetical protein
LEGFCVKEQGYNCNLDKDQGSRCKMAAKFLFLFKTRTGLEFLESSRGFVKNGKDWTSIYFKLRDLGVKVAFSWDYELFMYGKCCRVGSRGHGP